MDILVKKRNKSSELFDADKVNKVVKWACDGVSGVLPDEVCMAFNINIKNGITTKEIHEGLIQAAVGLIKESSPNYEIVASNLLNYSLRKEVWGGKDAPDFLQFLKDGVKAGRYNKALLENYTESEISNLGKYIKHDRDFLFKYSGLSQVVDKYLVKNVISKQVYETPNFAYMLIAMMGFYDDKDRVKAAYDAFSLHKISLPTPIFAGFRTNFDSFASCGLIDVGDSVSQICAAFDATAKATAKRYGIGLDFSKMRALKAPIRNGEAAHTGKVAFLRIVQDLIKAWMQTSTRSGAATVTVPIWDYEIEEILQLKDVMRTPDTRVGDIDYSIANSKIFYQRYKNDEQITLFSSHEVPDLVNSYGLPEFDELYKAAESNPKIKMKKQVSAREIFRLFRKYQLETGRYYMFNIDNANSHSTFLDRVSMFNLCQEVGYGQSPIEHLNDENSTIGVCTLAATVPQNIKSDEDLESCCDIIVRLLDKIIDYQSYFSKAAERFAKKYRSLGIGITGLASWLAKKGLTYSSIEARTEVHKFMEKYQYYLLKSSATLAKEKGACEWYDKTKFSKGVLNIDTYCKNVDKHCDPTLYMDWDWLRGYIKENGLRNSTVTAQMPCEACVKWDQEVFINKDKSLNFHEICDLGLVNWREIEDCDLQGWHFLAKPLKLETRNGKQEVDKVYYNGISSVTKIELEDGSEVLVTENHKFLTQNGWKKCSELQEDDEILEV